jgi:hypothetical protein
MVNGDGGDRFDDATARVLGPVSHRVIEGVGVYLEGQDGAILKSVTVTVREAAAVPGWVGVVDADLTPFAGLRLDLRIRGDRATPCTVMFLVGPKVRGQTLIRGTGPAPTGGAAPRLGGGSGVTPVPRELAEDILRDA